MKNFCLIVCLRLALFPLVFNLSFAQELEIDTDELSSRTSDSEVKDLETFMDSSATPQNDEQISPPPLYQEGQALDSSALPQNDNDSQDSDDTQDEELDEETPELIISEVYYDGKDERIEIFNI